MAKPSIDREYWKTATSITGSPRSHSLKQIDSALELYEKDPTAGYKKLSTAFEVWKKEQGAGDAWKRSARNKQGAFENLEDLLAKTNTDQFLNNVGDGIADDLAHTRLGVLYFFNQMNVKSDLFGDVMSTVVGLTGSAVGLGTKESIKALKDGGDTYGAMAASASIPVGKMALGKGGEVVAGKMSGLLDKKPVKDGGLGDAGAKGLKLTNGIGNMNLEKATATTLWTKLWAQFKEFAAKVAAWLADKFGSFDFTSLIAPAITAIVNACVQNAPAVVGDAVSIVKGTAVAIDGFWGRVQSHMREKQVTLITGYPKAVVDGIHRAMILSGMEGLATVAKSSISIGVTVGASAVAPIVNAAVAGASALFKFIYRLFEKARLERFISEAASLWKKRDADNSLHKSPLAFANWYRSHALTVPLIAAMTLNSGICGSKMHYLQLFTSTGDVVSQKEFDKGVKLLDNLKPRCAEFIRASPHKLSSSDPFVTKLLATHLTDPADLRNGVWAIVRGAKKLSFKDVKGMLHR